MNEFNNLPTSVKIGGGALGAVTIGGATWFLNRNQLLIFLGVLIVLLALFICGWLLWRSSKRRRNNAQISGGLVDDARATPKGISDPAKRAKLDDLRKKFQQGVQEYRSRGKDLYKLPWYVICGPPGAGKTEAIRRCNVGFPPGMQDGLQGVGGTINMNWWFTNQAVILDTAGKLMFEEVSPGETSEWREFLSLLKKSRANCPINGLFLAISVEDLIKDSSEKILQKAGKIAQQLDVIQRVLDVRFPVYVIVTKCDLLAGFREFFDDITDPQLQHQMVGWSNPETLDTPFRPELIDQHLKSVSQRLRGRRMGLLRDPIPESTDHRRTDEVDAMFALPNSLTLIGPRLRRYLETIFVAGEWSAKPLFLRGIYFTSSMREGSALDEELAQAIGVPVGELPDRRGWERERSFFLRDLFMEKVFKERGLVTRATNTGQLLRRRRAVLFGTGFAFVAVFLFFCFWGKGKFQNAIGEQASYWKAAETAQPIIKADKEQSKVVDQSKVLAIADKDFPFKVSPTLGQFHARLRELASTRINYSVFRPIVSISGGGVDPETMKKAQARVFERDVIWPLVTEARRKLAAPSGASDDGASDREAAALDTLAELEARLLQKNSPAPLSSGDAARFLSNLMSFVTEQDGSKADASLVNTFSWVYSQGARANNWPPPQLGEASAGKSSVIVDAFRRRMESAKQSVTTNVVDAQRFLALRKAYTNLYNAETDLISKIGLAGSNSELKAALSVAKPSLEAWEKALSEARQHILKGNAFSSEAAYTNSVDKNLGNMTASLKLAAAILEQHQKLQGSSPFREMKQIESDTRTELEEQSKKNSTTDSMGQRALDQWALARVSTGALYQARAEVYQTLADFLPSAGAKVGDRFGGFTNWQAQVSTLQRRLAGAGVGPELVRAATNYLDRISRSLARAMLFNFAQDVRARVLESLGYPMLRFESAPPQSLMDVSQIIAKKRLLADIEADMQVPAFANLMALQQPAVALTDFTNALFELQKIAAALVGENGAVPSCQIVLLNRKNDNADAWRDKAFYVLFNGDSKKFEYADTEPRQVALDMFVDFKFFSGVDMKPQDMLPELSLRYDKWGPIQMLHLGQANKEEEGLVRRVVHPLKNIASQSMLFELRFTNQPPLPKLGAWPTLESVTNRLQFR